MDIIKRLIEGYNVFFTEYFTSDNPTYRELAERQSPKALIIACSDSRVDPSIITKAAPGEIFVIRNVANLIPPYQSDTTYHGTSSALEFAVKHLSVEHIIVLGHTHCAGIHALLTREDDNGNDDSFITPWMNIADKARKKVLTQYKDAPIEQQAYHCEEEAIKISLHNLLSFPWIRDKVEASALTLHGWHFDVSSGALNAYDKETDGFEAVSR